MLSIDPASGAVGHGKGGGQASVDNAPFAGGGFGGFVHPLVAAYVDGNNGWVPYTYNLQTGEKKPVPSIVVPVNDVYANGGVIAGMRKSGDDDRGLWASTGFRVKDGAVLAVGPSGQIVYKPLYHSLGPTRIREVNGTDWELTSPG